jgi:microcystin-dependent protein
LTWSWNVHGQTASGSTTYDFRNYDVLVLYSANPAINVTHNADGSLNINFSASAGGGTLIGSASCSGSMGLTTIPRASVPTADGDNIFNAGETITIVTNRASTSFTHNIEYFFGNASGTIANGVGASTTWAVPLTLLNQFPNSASGSGFIRTHTIVNGSSIGHSDVGIVIGALSTAVPDFTTITHSEATTGVASNVGAYVETISKLALAITGAAGYYGSTITSYKIEILKGSTILQTINSSSGTSLPLSADGTITLRGKVTDSRGRSTTKTVSITVLNYVPPTITTATARRALSGGTVDEDDGTYIRVDLNAAVQSLMNTTQRNALNYRLSTRTRGTSTWTVKSTVTPGGLTFNSNVLLTGPYAITTAYEVKVEVYDDFITTATILQVPVAAIFMHWDAELGVGFGKFRENGMVDVAGDIFSRNGAVAPIGSVEMWMTDTPPMGWLLMQGQAVSRVTYSILYALWGTTFGSGDGSTTFNLPNLKGRVPVGKDTGQTEFNALGETGGAKTHTLSVAEMPSHTHDNGLIRTTAAGSITTGTGIPPHNNAPTGTWTDPAATGGGGAHNNLQPYLVVNWIVKAA